MEENYQYVEDLPLATVVPQTKLPESNLGKIFTEFKTTLPQYTRVNPNAINQEETLEQAMDRINNTPTGVNYIPNIAAPVTVGVDTSKYKDVDISLAQIQSGKLEQYAAQSQSYWDKLWNDTKVTGANLGIGFASAFTSIYDMINDGSFIPSENSVTSKLGKISSEFAEKNTNFQTQYDIDNPIKSLLLPSFLTGSSKGWGEIAKSASIGVGTGAGILVQELGITALTGGTGSIPLLANNIRNLIRNSKVITQAAETASGLRAGTTSIAKGVQSVLALENTIAAANTTKNIINLGKNTVRSALSAYGESAFEAQETRDSFTLEKIKEFKDANGRLPNEKELKRIKDVAEQAHDARFLLNFGLLTFSNMPFLNGVFKQFDDVLSVSEQAAAKGLKYTGRAGDGFEKSFQLTSNWWNKNAVTKGMKTAIETGQPLAKNILTGKSITWSEGLEEGYQFWVDKATNNYYNTIYNKGTNDIIDGTLTDTIYGLANSFYKTKEQLLSTEGLQNIIGGILGGTGQSIVSKGIDIAKNGFEDQFKEGSKFRTDTTQQVKEGTKELLELQKAINLESITGDLSSKVEAVRGAYTGVGLMQESNSVITFDKLKDITKFHTIAPMVMRGQTDILKDDLTKSLLETDDEQFKLMTGVSEVNPGIKQKYISDILNDIDKVDKSVRRNLSTFRNKYQKGTEEYDLYENAKKVFAFHGYISENMIERKKDLESKNSILFNAPNISSALELATQGTNREGLLNQIKQRKTQFESDIQIATPVVKEGEKTEIDIQTQQLIKQKQEKIDILTALENKVNGFKGENVQEVFELLTDVLIGFDQLDLVANDDSLNLQNQLDKILNTFTDHQRLSTNLAEHLETYNNLVQNYSDSKKLKETLDKYKEQGMIVQSSFKGLKEFNKFKDVRSYFTEKATEVGLSKESEFFKEITKGIKQLQAKDAEFEEYKELIDKNIEQFQKENQPEEIPDEEEKSEIKPIKDSLLNYKSFITKNKSVYNILPNGTIQRFKTALNDPNYKGVDKGQLALRDPSDIILFFDGNSTIGKMIDYFNNGGVTRNIPSQTFLLQGTEGNYRIIKNNLELDNSKESFLLILPLEVAKNINIENLNQSQIETYTKSFLDSYIKQNNLDVKYFGLNKFYNFSKIDNNISFVPKIGFQTFDYKVDQTKGLQLDRHIGNEVISIEKQVETEEQPDVETQTADDVFNLDLLETLKEINKRTNIKGVKKDSEAFKTLETYIDQLNTLNNQVIKQEFDTELKTRVLKNIEFLTNKINKILNTVTEEEFDAEVDKEEKPSPKPEVKEEEIETPSGSINSKALETIVYVENGEVLNLKQNPEKLSQLANNVQDVLLGNKLNIDELDFELTKNKVLPDTVNLKYDTAFKRGTSPDSVQITKNGTFVMLVQSTENLFLDVPLILKHTKGLTKQEIQNFGKTDIRITDALKEGVLTERVFNLMKEVRYNGKKLLELNEDFETFKNIVLNQQEKYNELKSSKNLKSKFKELYELTPYANGMNPNEEGKYVEADFTPDLPFNFIGNWKNPIFTLLSENDIGAENSNVSKTELIDAKLKLKAKLNELKEKNPNFYNILKDQGTFFTAFTTELGEIFIKPIILRKSNNSADGKALELENKVFNEKGEYIKGQAKLLGEDYVFFAFDQKVNGQSVRLKFVENEKGQLNAAFVVFSERDDEKVYYDYYLNNLSKEDFKNLLNGKLTKKPQIREDKKGILDSDYLDVYNLTIVERIKNRDVSKLLDGSYRVKDVNNPTSIFQNVGFRLKFKEKQEKEIIPKSLVIETPEVEKIKTYDNKEGIDFVFEQNSELEKIGSKEQYSEYLKTIFPESKVQDIVYHGTDKQFERFDKYLSGLKTGWGGRFKGIHFFNNSDAATTYKKSRGDYEEFLLLYLYVKQFAKNGKSLTEKEFNNIISDKRILVKVLEEAHYYGAIDIDSISFKEYENWANIFNKDSDLNNFNDSNLDNLTLDIVNKYINEKGNIIKAILNIKNPLTYNAKGKRYVQVVEKVYDILDKSNDGILIENTLDRLNDDIGFEDNIQVVFEPEQIHILGNKKDEEMFSEFVNGTKPVFEKMYNVTEEDKQAIKSEEPINKSIEDKIKDLEGLAKENLKGISYSDDGNKVTPVWEKLKDEFKNEDSLSEIFSIFAKLENTKNELLKEDENYDDLYDEKKSLEKTLKSYFIESKSIPITQRAIIDNKEIEEIAKQYAINCK